jgi:hypothetical protein
MRKRLRGVSSWVVVLVGLLLPVTWGAQAPAAADAGWPASAPGPVAASAGAAGVASRVGPALGPDPAQTEPPLRVCDVPRSDRAQPEPTNELRVARDSNGDYWQIQWGCRHRVVPLAMDPVALRAIPQGEDVAFVTFGAPSPVPTPAPLDLPAYAMVPRALQPTAVEVPLPQPAPPVPGYLQGYTNRVLVYDPGEPNALYLLEGGLRHRVMVFYPYCAVYPRGLPLCPNDADGGGTDLARGGDPTAGPPYPYLLRRNPNVNCADLYEALRALPGPVTCAALYEQMFREALRRQGVSEVDAIELARRLAAASADYVATIEEIPLGEPAPYYGWGRGESLVLTDRVRLPDAVRCNPPRTPCSARFENAQRVPIAQYLKDPTFYEGSDIRLTNETGQVGAVACNVRYDRTQNVTRLTLGLRASVVPATAPGPAAARDPQFVDNAFLDVAAAVTPASEGGAAGQLVIFEYQFLGTGACVRGGG